MHYSGLNFDINIGIRTVTVQTATLEIEDNSAPASEKGRPTGHTLDGSVSASGELVLSTPNFKLLIEEAKRAGSWRAMDNFDISFYASKGNDSIKIEAFGCNITISQLLDIDQTDGGDGDTVTHTLPYTVCGKDFVHVDGVPYLDN